MQVELKRPDLERFIAQQIQSGSFSSASEVIEAAVELMMHNCSEMDLETVAAIQRGIAQLDQGECVDFEVCASRLRALY